MLVYILDGEIYCEDCGNDMKISRRNRTELGEADCPHHCGNHEDCRNAITLSDHKVGMFLENDLTTHGVNYLNELIEENNQEDQINEVVHLWYHHYRHHYQLITLKHTI